MTKGGKLDVWCEEVVCSGASQCYHLCELFIYWLVPHVLKSNPTRLSVLSHDCGLNHSQEDKVVIIFTLHNAVNKPHPD